MISPAAEAIRKNAKKRDQVRLVWLLVGQVILVTSAVLVAWGLYKLVVNCPYF